MHSFELQGITQVIEAEAGKVQNLAEFRAFGSNGFLNVEGTVDPVEVQKYGKEMVRVDVKFTAFKIKVGVLPTLTIPLTWPKTPTVSLHNILLLWAASQIFFHAMH